MVPSEGEGEGEGVESGSAVTFHPHPPHTTDPTRSSPSRSYSVMDTRFHIF